MAAVPPHRNTHNCPGGRIRIGLSRFPPRACLLKVPLRPSQRWRGRGRHGREPTRLRHPCHPSTTPFPAGDRLLCTTVGLDDAVPVTVPFEETAGKRLDALPPPLSSSGPVRHSGTDQGQRRRRRQPKRAESSRPLPHRTKRGPPTAPRRAQGSRVEDQIPPPPPPVMRGGTSFTRGLHEDGHHQDHQDRASMPFALVPGTPTRAGATHGMPVWGRRHCIL